MSARYSGLSAWRSAFRATSDNWLTRFFTSWRMKAKRRLNSSKRWAWARACWPWASARLLAACRPAVLSRSKSSQSSARRKSDEASSTSPISRPPWTSGTPHQAWSSSHGGTGSADPPLRSARRKASKSRIFGSCSNSAQRAWSRPSWANPAPSQFHTAACSTWPWSSATSNSPPGLSRMSANALIRRSPSGATSDPDRPIVSAKRSHSVR